MKVTTKKIEETCVRICYVRACVECVECETKKRVKDVLAYVTIAAQQEIVGRRGELSGQNYTTPKRETTTIGFLGSCCLPISSIEKSAHSRDLQLRMI